VTDELASVNNETRERHPERVVGEQFWETTFLLPDELVEAETNDEIERESDEEDDQNSSGKLLTTA